jgi:O-antigen ligase
VALCGVSLWGFVQLALGLTENSYATWNASLVYLALGATAFIARKAVMPGRRPDPALRAFVWFAFALSLAAVLARLTQPSGTSGWGPFPNRNHFAAFLELALPVALWLSEKPIYLGIAAGFLAAGVQSASRAGAALLVLEAILAGMLLWRTRRSAVLRFVALSGLLVAALGAGELARRFTAPDAFQYRREIARSTLAMIADHPWRGFGLGTFQAVYPAYALFDAGKIVEHAHNDWLEWAAGGGIPFAMAWLVLVLALVRPAVRSVWGIGVLAVFLHATVDYPFARIAVSSWVFILIGGLLGERSHPINALFRRHDMSPELKFETTKSVAAPALAALWIAGLVFTGPIHASPLPYGAAVIGMLTTPGSIQIDHSVVQGNATLFEGATIETSNSVSSIELSWGTHVSLAAFSRARVFADRLILEKGEINFRQPENRAFRLEVPELMAIRPETDDVWAQVALGKGASATVAAFSGSLDAWNTRGLLIAKLPAGKILEFDPQPSGTPSRITGCLTKRGGHFLLTDETTNIVVEVGGAGLLKEQGNRVEITGQQDPATTPAPDAAQYIRVTSVKRISKGCEKSNRSAVVAGSGGARVNKPASPSSAPPGTTPRNGAEEVQQSADAVDADGKINSGRAVSGKTIAIVAGVAIAAGVGGLAAAGKLKNNPQAAQPLSQ